MTREARHSTSYFVVVANSSLPYLKCTSDSMPVINSLPLLSAENGVLA